MIYLDSNATSQPDPAVIEAMLPFLREAWVNPSAGYAAARGVRRALEQARGEVAALIGAQAEEICFTSCGTESINAVHASARALWPQRRRLVITGTEHTAVLEAAARWSASGGEVAVAAVGADGRVCLDSLRALVLPGETALVSILWANNETGVVAPMAEITEIAHSAGALVHSDAVQIAGKMAVDVTRVPVDYLSLSGHKFHAPKGVGALFISRRARFQPWIVGGGQESGRRSGTENGAGIVGMGRAAALMLSALEEGGEDRVGGMRDAFETTVCEALPDTIINGSLEHRLPTTSSLTFPGADAAGLLILLDKAGVCCSAGSACHSASLHPSHVLEAMGFDAAHAASTLRFSFSRFNTAEETLEAARRAIAAVEKMRALRPDGAGPVLTVGFS